MAADGKVEMQLQISHGPKKYALRLTLTEDNTSDVLTVDHLIKAVADVSNVKPQNQKLIYKGKSLTEPSQSLVSLGVRDGAKIMLLGRKAVAHDTEEVKKLFCVEIALEKHREKMVDMVSEIDGISKGYLNDELVNPALSRLKKRVATSTVHLMNQFEILDALRFDEDNNEAKVKRKNVAEKLNKCLDKCEALSEQIKELISRTS